jgi:hypothetical protein
MKEITQCTFCCKCFRINDKLLQTILDADKVIPSYAYMSIDLYDHSGAESIRNFYLIQNNLQN